MKLFISYILLLSSLSSIAQQSKQIEADRPGETQNASVVQPKKFQVELSAQKEERDDESSVFHPEALFRYGLFKKFELRAQLRAETRKLTDAHLTLSGLNPVELGFKLSLIEGKGALPDVSVLSQFGLPELSSDDFKTPNVLPTLRLLLQNKLNDKISLGYNLGVEWDEAEQPPAWVYTISPQFDLTDHWQLYLEAFGRFRTESKPEEVLDASIAWIPVNNIQIDINGGAGISSAAPKYFISVGFAWRL